MSPRSGKQFRTSAAINDWTLTHRHAAGIDVHAAMHMVSVSAEDVPAGFINPEAKLPAGVRKFGTNTGDLEAMAAWRRIPARCGGAKAIVATARKIAERVYRLLKYGQEYVRQGEQAYEEAYRLRPLQSMAKKAARMGYQLVPETMSA